MLPTLLSAVIDWVGISIGVCLMREGCIITGVLLVCGVVLLGGEALARVPTAQVATMSPGADGAQLQSAALEWIRVTATSSEFLVGLLVGVGLAEGGRFLMGWLSRILQAGMSATRFVIQHRLIALAAGAVGYYVLAQYVLA